jgi:hypothetical protein
MSNVGWFFTGMFVYAIISLLTTTTPDQAVANLRAWWAVIARSRS